jgi:5-methylcytosine-specific restriction endonuclease McrA
VGGIKRVVKGFARVIEKDGQTLRICTRCLHYQPLSSFNKSILRHDGFRSACKTCHAREQRKQNTEKPELLKARNERYKTAHPFRVDVHHANIRAKRCGALSTITAQEWEDKVRSLNFVCQLCGVITTLDRQQFNTLSLEHVLPLSRGGANTIENAVPACTACNQSKSNRTLEEFKGWIATVAVFQKAA